MLLASGCTHTHIIDHVCWSTRVTRFLAGLNSMGLMDAGGGFGHVCRADKQFVTQPEHLADPAWVSMFAASLIVRSVRALDHVSHEIQMAAPGVRLVKRQDRLRSWMREGWSCSRLLESGCRRQLTTFSSSA